MSDLKYDCPICHTLMRATEDIFGLNFTCDIHFIEFLIKEASINIPSNAYEKSYAINIFAITNGILYFQLSYNDPEIKLSNFLDFSDMDKIYNKIKILRTFQ